MRFFVFLGKEKPQCWMGLKKFLINSMIKLNNLFESKEGKSARQIEIEELYIKKGIDFVPIIKEALNETIRNPTPNKFRGRGFMASNMNWTLIGLLKENYSKYMMVDQHKRDYFLLDNNVRVYFKKLDKKNRPNNIITKHVSELNSMQLLFKEETTILYAGFRIREDIYWDDILCHLVEMKNPSRPNWVSSMEELAYQMDIRKTNNKPIFRADIPDEIIIKPKNIANNGDLGNLAI